MKSIKLTTLYSLNSTGLFYEELLFSTKEELIKSL